VRLYKQGERLGAESHRYDVDVDIVGTNGTFLGDTPAGCAVPLADGTARDVEHLSIQCACDLAVPVDFGADWLGNGVAAERVGRSVADGSVLNYWGRSGSKERPLHARVLLGMVGFRHELSLHVYKKEH
jgi:hypothetical protein